MSYDYDKDTEQNIDKADKEKVSDDETDNIEVIVEGQSEEEMYWIDNYIFCFFISGVHLIIFLIELEKSV